MNQTEWDNQEEVFVSEYTPEEEKHQALTDAIMAEIVAEFEDVATEVLMILSDRLRKMALGEVDSEGLISIIDMVFNSPINCRHDPLNRFILDAIYSESLEIAKLDL